MPAERIAMRQVRDVLRLNAAGVSGNEIARRVGVASSTVRLTLKRLAAAGLELAVAGRADRHRAGSAALHRGRQEAGPSPPRRARLGGGSPRAEAQARHAADPVGRVHRAASRRLPLLALLRAVPGLGVALSVTMRQTHAGGDKLFVDYAGDTVPVIIDRLTGKTRPAQIFVAVLGASNFTYAEASWTQALADWIGAHTRAFEAIGGVPNLLVPDNTKVAVIKACLYEPQVNRTYAEMAAHYDTAILPARPRRPRDKAKVEAAVLIVERWLLGPAAPSPLLQPGRTQRGDRRAAAPAQRGAADPPARRHPPRAARGTRPAAPQGIAQRALFLRRMAAAPGRHRLSRRGRGSLLQRPVPLRPSRGRGAADAAHRRGLSQGRADRRASALQRQSRHTTVADHMPSSHRRYADWTVERIRHEAAAIGPATAALCELILERRPHPEQGFRSCLGIVRLVRPFGAERLEAAATRAIEIGTLTYGSVRSILDNKLDRQAAQPRPAEAVPVLHPNIRGPRYYH